MGETPSVGVPLLWSMVGIDFYSLVGRCLLDPAVLGFCPPDCWSFLALLIWILHLLNDLRFGDDCVPVFILLLLSKHTTRRNNLIYLQLEKRLRKNLLRRRNYSMLFGLF